MQLKRASDKSKFIWNKPTRRHTQQHDTIVTCVHRNAVLIATNAAAAAVAVATRQGETTLSTYTHRIV